MEDHHLPVMGLHRLQMDSEVMEDKQQVINRMDLALMEMVDPQVAVIYRQLMAIPLEDPEVTEEKKRVL